MEGNPVPSDVSVGGHDWWLNPEDVIWSKEHKLGEGGFGDVYRGLFRGVTPVAVKVLRLSRQDAPDKVRMFLSETETWWKLRNHANVLNLFGASLDPSLLVSPLCQNGDAQHYLKRNPKANRVKLLSDIARGMAFLHAENIVHADLKPLNILIGDDGQGLVADFGSSKQEKGNVDRTIGNRAGTWLFMPPERLRGEGPTSKEGDVFAFGMTAFQLWGSGPLYPNVSEADIVAHLSRVANEGVRPDIDALDDMPDGLKELIKACWDGDKQARPTFTQIVETLGTMIPHGSNSDAPRDNNIGSYNDGVDIWLLSAERTSKLAPKGPSADEYPLLSGWIVTVANDYVSSSDVAFRLLAGDKFSIQLATSDGTCYGTNTSTRESGVVSQIDKVLDLDVPLAVVRYVQGKDDALELQGKILVEHQADMISGSLLLRNDVKRLLFGGSNIVTILGHEKVADAIKGCEQLVHLDLSGLGIREASAKTISAGLKPLTQLEKLWIQNNHFGPLGSAAIAESLLSWKTGSLTELRADACKIGSKGAVALSKALRLHRSVERLGLSDNDILDEGVLAVADALSFNSKLCFLSIRNNGITNVGLKSLAYVLRVKAQMTHLTLAGNAFGESGAKDLAVAVSAMPQLLYLNLAANELGKGGAKDLAEALKSTSKLRSLILARCNLGEYGTSLIASALMHLPSLSHVELGANSCGAVGAKSVCEALKSKSSLRVFGFSRNMSGKSGARSLAEMFGQREQLSMLDMSWNFLGPEGMKILCENFEVSETLEDIFLENNNLSDRGVAELGKVIRSGKGLRRLNLSANGIHERGIKSLTEALNGHIELRSIALSKNRFGPEGAKALSDVIKFCSMLESLDINDTAIGDSGLAPIALALANKANLAVLQLKKSPHIKRHETTFPAQGLQDASEDTIGRQRDWSGRCRRPCGLFVKFTIPSKSVLGQHPGFQRWHFVNT
ncbi:RNI-like protein [Gonapodya prolifera JEL478]|uniref:RNI-like protein n=1 Tax=Gonapodya prolifera (strain JEL478) TaxID=1344416 RepID=A0A139AK33_GONPJ|nr:RNI-like protein [Gonapodya prolifera JEL478]|eukprot:KXS16785.1 RNI-like protein [Gonapodya prolifera JEL478]